MKWSKLDPILFTGTDAHHGDIRPSASANRLPLLLLVVAACGFPRPPDVGDDMPGDSSNPGVTVHVSPSGDDVHDGRTQPVKTLRRAIAIAGTNTDITTIAIDAGRYTAQAGETFPYVVPSNVKIAGAAVGSTTLAGTRAEDALAVAGASLQDLEFEDFMVAVAVTGTADLKNVHVRTSHLALRGASTSKITVNNLEIVGPVDSCGSGIELNGAADLMADTLTTRNLVTTLAAKDMSTVDITKADITGDPRCTGLALSVATNKSFTLRNSSVVGTYAGIQINGTVSSPTQAIITDTTISNITNSNPVDGTFAMLTIIGGEIANNPMAIEFRNGKLTLMNVKIDSNGNGGGSAIFMTGTGAQSLGSLSMRGCTVTNNRYGVAMFDYSVADLGTDANPGNNTFQDNQLGGVTLGGSAGPQQVNAVGNTWNPGVQGSDVVSGKYSIPMTVTGPIQQALGNNYDMWAGLSLRR